MGGASSIHVLAMDKRRTILEGCVAQLPGAGKKHGSCANGTLKEQGRAADKELETSRNSLQFFLILLVF
jgi:hypothetical protein